MFSVQRLQLGTKAVEGVDVKGLGGFQQSQRSLVFRYIESPLTRLRSTSPLFRNQPLTRLDMPHGFGQMLENHCAIHQ